MRPWLAPLAVLVLAGPLRADDDVAKAVAGLVADLGDDDVDKREAALTALIHLGVKAEKAVRAELKKATDPEIQGRLMAALQAYTVAEEEAWALERIRTPEAFPPSKEGCNEVLIPPLPSVADALELLRQQSGVTIEPYARDPDLPRMLELAPLPMSANAHGPGCAERSLWQLLCIANLTSVVDGTRVVIVRYTPALLFERLAREPGRVVRDWLEEDLQEFETGPANYSLSAKRFVREKANAGGLNRDAWFALLRNRALDASESAPNRTAALVGLSVFLGAIPDPQQDVDDLFLSIARDTQAPASMRQEAARGIAMGLTPAAHDGLLDLLAGTDADIQGFLLESLIDTRIFAITARQRMNAHPQKVEKLRNTLKTLAGSKSESIALRSTIVLIQEGSKDAAARLVTLPDPAELKARLYFIRALRDSPDPKAKERFSSFAKDADPEVRAATVHLAGYYPGGKNRESDAGLALSLLADPAPLVRHFAAQSLGVIYSRHAEEVFDAGLDAARARLAEMEKGEKDARVLEAVRKAMKGMGG